MITLNINVKEIDKSKLHEGAKGTYLDCVLIETPNSEYSDYMIVQSTTKAEREAGVKGAILGNAKQWKRQDSNQNPEGYEADPPNGEGKDDLPF